MRRSVHFNAESALISIHPDNSRRRALYNKGVQKTKEQGRRDAVASYPGLLQPQTKLDRNRVHIVLCLSAHLTRYCNPRQLLHDIPACFRMVQYSCNKALISPSCIETKVAISSSIAFCSATSLSRSFCHVRRSLLCWTYLRVSRKPLRR
jgi:hypothetical protein